MRRQEAVKALYAESFIKQKSRNELVEEILKNLPEIDNKITAIAPEFPIDKINRVDLAILRLGVYELALDAKEPEKAVIDEAIELAKEFGNDSSAAFVNGALGKLVQEIKK
jgi:N utilization substance protein B